MHAIQSVLAGIVPGTPSQSSMPLPNLSPATSPSSTSGSPNLNDSVAQLLQSGNNSVIGALLKGLNGDDSSNNGGRRKWPCRSCKQMGHNWPRCPQLNVVNVIVSLIMTKQEQANTESNLQRVSDTLLQLGLSPAALGVGNRKDKSDNSQTGAAAALAAALTNSLGNNQQGLSHQPAALMATAPQTAVPMPSHAPANAEGPTAVNLQALFHSLGIANTAPAPSVQSQTGVINSIANNNTCAPSVQNALLMALGVHQHAPQEHQTPPMPVHTSLAALPLAETQTQPLANPEGHNRTDDATAQAPPPKPAPQPARSNTLDAGDAHSKAAEAAIQRLLSEQRKNCPPGPPDVPEFFAAPKPLAMPQAASAPGNGAGSSSHSAISVDTDAMEDDRENALPKRTRNDRTPAAQKQSSINVDETSTPASKRTLRSSSAPNSEPATPLNLARALETEMAQSAPATNTHVQALERQLEEYKKLLEDYMASGAPKPTAKRVPKNTAKKLHEAGTLDLPARQALTKSVRNPQDGASVFAIKLAPPRNSYIYIRGIVDRSEGTYVYIKVVPDIAVAGTCNDPDLEVFDKNWIFGSETFVNEAIVRLNELLTATPSSPN